MDLDGICKLLEKQDDRMSQQDIIIGKLDYVIRGQNGTPGLLEQNREVLKLLTGLQISHEQLVAEHREKMKSCPYAGNTPPAPSNTSLLKHGDESALTLEKDGDIKINLKPVEMFKLFKTWLPWIIALLGTSSGWFKNILDNVPK